MMAVVPLVEALLPCGRHVKWVSLAWLPKFVHVRRTSSIAASASNVTEKVPLQKPGKSARTEGLSGTSSREDVRAIRIKKIEEMKGQAYEPYAGSWKRTHKAIDLQEKYMHLGNGLEANGDEDHVSVAGRIVARRVFGKLAFLTLRDDSASIQLYCEKTKMEEAKFDQLKTLMDIGDFVGAVGTIKRTEKGELSVCTTEVVILTKSLLPLPDKWHGLTDIEKRYRQRYLDMIMNPDVAKVFQTRAKAITEIRKHLEGLSYMEIETPILQGAAGGADARPFITYHNALGQDMFLRIATELHLKRMVVGGLERVYEIGRIFRNEGLSPRHNPEFTSVEIYQAYADYTDMMVMAEELVTKCALAIHGRLNINYQGTEIIFKRPWRRATMHALVHEVTGIDFTNFETESDLEAAKSAAFSALSDQDQHAKLFISSCTSVGQLLNEVFEAVVEKTLIQPTFVTHYPVEVSPLAKRHRSLPGLAERFELFIFGRELANAFSELTDPIEQRVRLEAQIQVHNERMSAARENAKEQGGAALNEHANEAYEVKLDDDFLTALEYGMPPTAGMGIGIDRLVMLLTDSASIRDVIAFPMLKAVPSSESS